MRRRIACAAAMAPTLLAWYAQADEHPRFDYEAAAELGAHTIGDEEVQMGEPAKVFALRVQGAPGGVFQVGDGQTDVGGHAVVAGMIADRGGGLSAGGDLLIRRHAPFDRAIEARVAVLAGLAGDDGHPPWMILPGVGLMLSESVGIRLDGEMSKKDLGGGYGYGAYAGASFAGKGAAIASGVIAGIGLALLGIAAASLGP